MSFLNCPVCDGKVSTSALTCPHCGHPLWTKKISRFRRSLIARLKASWSVLGFVLAAIFLSTVVWLRDSALELLALAPFTSDAQSTLPISLFTYAFVHPPPLFLFFAMILLVIPGLILEPRIGSRTTLLIILGGIFIPGLFWMAFGEGEITGSSGVFYGIGGGLLALWHRQRSRLILLERISIVIIMALTALAVISSIFSPVPTWTLAVGVPVGYGIALGFGRLFKAVNDGSERKESANRDH